jgi:Icc-related predicted phosphoesterase
MKIQYCSDLHLEFTLNTYFLHSNKIIPKADYLILAGDIYPFSKSTDKVIFFDYLSENFNEVYWLAGNHEYYYSDIVRFHKFKKNKIRSNVHIVDNEVKSINGVNFIFSTLWSKISPNNELHIKSRVSDFFTISIDGEAFRPKHFNQLHDESLGFITDELSKRKSEKNVVITHHVPTLLNYPAAYKASLINEAFAVELHDLIVKYQPEVWVYGHSHVNTPEFTIGKTKLLTNQLGYVDMQEHETFRLDAFFEI